MTIVQAIPLFAVLAGAPALYATETTAADQASDTANSAKDSTLQTGDSVKSTGDSLKADDSAKSDQLAPMPASETAANTASGCPVARVHFAFDSADIPAADQASLHESAACLKKNERLHVTVEGNTDDRGSSEYNQGLAERRAQAVAQYLEGQGISSEQLKTMSFGEDRPVCNQQNEECWARNRRTAIRPACHL